MKNKILLVHPSLRRLYPLESESSKRHKLEPLSLEMIQSHNPYNVDSVIYDMDVYPNVNDFTNFLADYLPTVVGITINTPVVKEAKSIIETSKKVLPRAFFIVGGNHATHLPEHSLSYTGADMVWRGDAEDFLQKVVEWDLPDGVRTGKINKIYTGKSLEDEEGKFVMDRLNFPYRHKPADYFYTTMQTSRGCIWKCIYCGSADKSVRWRTAQNIINELLELDNLGLIGKNMYFLDDCFLDYPKRVYELCHLIKQHNLHPHFWVETRADTINSDIIKAIKEIGCYQLTFGLESGNQKILDSLNKKLTITKVRESIKICVEEGMRIRANFMIGHLGETENEVMDTIKFAEELMNLGVTTIAFYKVLPLPGTPLFRMVMANGIKIEREFEDFAWYGKTVSRMSKIEPERLDELHKLAYERIESVSNKNRKESDY